jgi:hypothetical protein
MSVIVGSVGVVLQLTVTRAAGSSLDMGTVTAASIASRAPKLSATSGEAYIVSTWTPSITHVSASQLVLSYPFASGDVDRIGGYHLAVTLTSPGLVTPCLPVVLPVVDRF